MLANHRIPRFLNIDICKRICIYDKIEFRLLSTLPEIISLICRDVEQKPVAQD